MLYQLPEISKITYKTKTPPVSGGIAHNNSSELMFKIVQLETDKEKKKLKKYKKTKSAFKPQWIQIQAALYLGCTRISCFTYSKPASIISKDDLEFKFNKPTGREGLYVADELYKEIMLEEEGKPIVISQLPSCARMCLNIICIPQENSCKHIKKTIPPVSGSTYSVV